jgi:hypothetical protein
MKYAVLLLSLILCTHVHGIMPAAVEESHEDIGATGTQPNQAVRRDLQRPAPDSPSVSTRILQLEADPGPTTSPPAPTDPPMSVKERADPDPCPSSSSCRADFSLMHKSCVTSYVPDARVRLKMQAGWVCGRCR